jgi:hypothetical protein
MSSKEIRFDLVPLPELPNPVTQDKMTATLRFLAELNHKAAVYDAIKRRYAILYEGDWSQVTTPADSGVPQCSGAMSQLPRAEAPRFYGA